MKNRNKETRKQELNKSGNNFDRYKEFEMVFDYNGYVEACKRLSSLHQLLNCCQIRLGTSKEDLELAVLIKNARKSCASMYEYLYDNATKTFEKSLTPKSDKYFPQTIESREIVFDTTLTEAKALKSFVANNLGGSIRPPYRLKQNEVSIPANEYLTEANKLISNINEVQNYFTNDFESEK